MPHGKICYIEIPANKAEDSASFYSSVFGWQVRQRGDGNLAFDESGSASLAGLVPVIAGLALWLGSLAGSLLAIVPVTLLALRIVVEERMVNDRLPGYAASTQRVRTRLLPGIW